MRLNNGRKWACDGLTEDADFGKKKIFSDEAHFDPSAERIFLCILLNNAEEWARVTEDTDFGKKKSSFQMKLVLILASI